MKKNMICDLLGIEYPIIQAPMTWITGAELVAAVSNAGGLGTIGHNAGEMTVTTDVLETGERLRRQIRKVRALTNRPFAVNIAIPSPDAPRGKEFSDQCVKVVLEEKVPAVIAVGNHPSIYTSRLKDAGVKVLYRPIGANVAAAVAGEQAGVDVLIAVGYEGGGHSSTDRIPTFVLVPQVASAVKIPVVAGGGIVDGRGAAAALALGAEAVFMGTRFIASQECAAHPGVKQAIIRATDVSTVVVPAGSSVLRALKNRLMESCLKMAAGGTATAEAALALRNATHLGLVLGDLENGNIACGAGASLIREIPSAARVVRDTMAQLDG